MTPAQFRQADPLSHRGKDLPPEGQRALLDAECNDAEVRAKVEKLLALADPDEALAGLNPHVTLNSKRSVLGTTSREGNSGHTLHTCR